MYSWLRPWLFRLDPELTHTLSLSLIRLAGSLLPARWLLNKLYAAPHIPVRAFGINFNNPVGLAAGYDKDALGWRGLACLGFGHIEVGTVTPLPQPGNPRPRIFRLIEDQAVINSMGFPGLGAQVVAAHLKNRPSGGPVIGVNIGKNKDTPLEQAGEDYSSLVKTFAPLADYLAVNVSSPNTVGLRRLQGRAALQKLLTQVQASRLLASQELGRSVPILVKLSPDLDPAELDDALDVIQGTGMDGVIATNTTLSRPSLLNANVHEAGGLSGAPLHHQSLQMVRQIVQSTNGHLPVIGVGGIMDAAGARRMLDAGAVLVQVYTGLVYAGPGLVTGILRALKQSR
jgi:dihydroorotate dehydrogenase